MKCPKCGYEWKLPGQQKGGMARVKKGLACRPDVQARIQAKRNAKRQAKSEAWI